MKVLHIANDFSGSKVHSNLYRSLDKMSFEQVIFNPVRDKTQIGNNTIDFKVGKSELIYSKPILKIHRIFFRHKIEYLFNDLAYKTNLKNVGIVHATTLFSDGAIALKIFKKYKTPYIVAVRGTDVSLFLKYRPDLIFLLKDILYNASKIIFLSEVLKKRFLNYSYLKTIGPKILAKIVVISNGVDNFWLSDIALLKKLRPNKVLFIGNFNYNKNILDLINAMLLLRKEYPDLKLDLVGKGGEYEKQVIELSTIHEDFIKYHGPIYNQEELRKVYLSNHIFAMPSHSETFGLVYIEALSQGLPILCSKNQGVDGTFKLKIGEYVNPKSVESIANGLRKIILEYSSYQIADIDFSIFQWEKVSMIYKEIYLKVGN